MSIIISDIQLDLMNSNRHFSWRPRGHDRLSRRWQFWHSEGNRSCPNEEKQTQGN